jgi:hypothetical protein
LFALVAQWIEQVPSKDKMRVRFPPGAQKRTSPDYVGKDEAQACGLRLRTISPGSTKVKKKLFGEVFFAQRDRFVTNADHGQPSDDQS